MLITCLVIGVATGSIAAAATLILGAGFFDAFLAYVSAGLLGITAFLAWVLLPSRSTFNASHHHPSNMTVAWQSTHISRTQYAVRKDSSPSKRRAGKTSGLDDRSQRRREQI